MVPVVIVTKISSPVYGVLNGFVTSVLAVMRIYIVCSALHKEGERNALAGVPAQVCCASLVWARRNPLPSPADG